MISERTIVVGGLPVHIFSSAADSPLDSITGKVALLFFLHGRQGSAAQVARVVQDFFDRLSELNTGKGKDIKLLVATYDQRNHGERLVSPTANEAWKEGNDCHAVDMYAMQTGTARDVSYLIDFLPSYLFPTGHAQITEWLVGGISLGGHATWLALRHEPRVSVGIPIIGCPDYLQLIRGRADDTNVPFAPPYMPATLLSLIQQHDPAQTDYTSPSTNVNPFIGKKILVLSGADDPIVPWHCSKVFVDGLNVDTSRGGVKKVIAYPGVGHDCTPDMVKEMATFIWDNVLA